MTGLRAFVCVLSLHLLSATVLADWYSGDPYTAPTAWPQYTDNLSNSNQILAMTFDNFTWVPGAGGGVVDRVGGHFHAFGVDNSSTYDTAYWEIRTGVAHNVAGTLVTSGSAPAVSTPTSFLQGGWLVWRTDVDVPDFTLAAGNYWFGLAIGASNGMPQGAFVASTTGTNGVGSPLGDDYSIYFQSINNVIGWDYIDGTTVVGANSAGLDPSYFISEVPEPGSLAGWLLGAAILVLRGQRCRSGPLQ